MECCQVRVALVGGHPRPREQLRQPLCSSKESFSLHIPPLSIANSPVRIFTASSVVPQPSAVLIDKSESSLCDDLYKSTVGLCDMVVGVLGGGQLGRMLCQAASCMGLKIAVLDPEKDCPASSLAYRQVVGSFRDTNAVCEFAKGCGALTVEIEHVEREGVDIEPKYGSFRTNICKRYTLTNMVLHC